MNGIKITFTHSEMDVILAHAKLACLGGNSRISTVRNPDMLPDQFTGQVGEAGLSKLLTGDIRLYNENRIERNKNPYAGDNGSDLQGFDADIKTSRMRYGTNRLYNLWVRPKEYHPEICYYLGLMLPDVDDEVLVAGWVYGSDMPFDGIRYAVRQDKLNPLQTSPYRIFSKQPSLFPEIAP